MSDFLLNEFWIPAAGWEGVYEVSNWGRLRRILKGRGVRNRETIPGTKDSHGYLRTHLTHGDKKESILYHRLICRSFHGEPENPDLVVLHFNDIPYDNRPENLRWGTYKQNSEDSIRNRNGLPKQSPNRDKTHCPRNHLYDESNTRKDDLGRRYCRACRRENWHIKDRSLEEGDKRHGTANGYLNYKCRCEPCTEAHTVYRRSRARQ